MKKLKLIYNPFSGNKSFKFNLDPVISTFQESGFETHVFRSINHGDIDQHIKEMDKDYYDTIVVSGGDGTINIVVNAIMNYGIKARLGIIPSGTANDFATFLKIPKEPDEAAKIITEKNLSPADIGLANGRYFINVCAAGLMSNISQHIDTDFKNALGKLAYYIKGIEQIPNFVPIPVKITNSTEVIEEDVYMYIVLNSAGTGGFEKLVPDASINDGLFDFVGFKATTIRELAMIFFKVFTGDYLKEPGIIHFKDSYIKIECKDASPEMNETDLDGEQGPYMPIEIKNIPSAIMIYTPQPLV